MRLLKKLWIPLSVLGLLIILSGGMVLYSSQPSFCNLCHVMTPYYEAWESSSHSHVPCVGCHIPPGPKAALWAKFQTINSVVHYVTKRYGTRPHAEIQDAACLRGGCHETRLLQGEVPFKRDIVFDHKEHLEEWMRGKRLRCTSCHSQIVVGNHMEVTESTCFLCHFKGTVMGRELKPIGGCPYCHRAPKEVMEVDGVEFNHHEFVESKKVPCENCHRDVVHGKGEAPKDRCLNCHNKPERLEKYGDTKFMHITHVTDHKVDCVNCHLEIEHKITPVKLRHQVKNCEICHTNTHLLTEKMLRGEGGRGAPTIPSHMFVARLDCASCHSYSRELPTTPGGGQTMFASEKACAQCHQEEWQGMLHDWKHTLKRMHDDLQPKVQFARESMKDLEEGHPKRTEAQTLLEDATFNLDYVEKARGIHNPFYAAELIVVADRKLDALFGEIAVEAPPLPQASPVRGTYCALLCHQRAKVQIPSQVTFEGVTFPHKRHAFQLQMGCTECHSAEKHKAIRVTRKDCSRCHHQEIEATCSGCHRQVASLYFAESLPTDVASATPNVMAESVECEGCHKRPQEHSREDVAKSCLDCHDKDYLEILDEWNSSIPAKQEIMETMLKEIKGKLSPDKREALRHLEQGEHILKFLERAKGVHNPELFEALSDHAMEELEQAKASLP